MNDEGGFWHGSVSGSRDADRDEADHLALEGLEPADEIEDVSDAGAEAGETSLEDESPLLSDEGLREVLNGKSLSPGSIPCISRREDSLPPGFQVWSTAHICAMHEYSERRIGGMRSLPGRTTAAT